MASGWRGLGREIVGRPCRAPTSSADRRGGGRRRRSWRRQHRGDDVLRIELEVVVGDIAGAADDQERDQHDRPVGHAGALAARRAAGSRAARKFGRGRRRLEGRRQRLRAAGSAAAAPAASGAAAPCRRRCRSTPAAPEVSIGGPGDHGRADDADVGLLHPQPDRGDAGQAIADLRAEMEFQDVALARRPASGMQPGFGAPPAVVGEMRVRALLALDRERQALGRGVEFAHAQDGVTRLGQGRRRTRGPAWRCAQAGTARRMAPSRSFCSGVISRPPS